MHHLLSDLDLDRSTRLELLLLSRKLKKGSVAPKGALAGRHLAVVMAKPSLRTRVSLTVAMRRLGGDVVEVGAHNTKLGKGESIEEWAAVLGRMVDVIAARVFVHEEVQQLARFSGVPVINALCDRVHPLQGLADLLTIWEHRLPDLESPTAAQLGDALRGSGPWCWLGDGNNVACSLMLSAAQIGASLRIAAPAGYEVPQDLLDAAHAMAKSPQSSTIEICNHPDRALEQATVVVTDTWVSMGQESERGREETQRVFAPYRVDEGAMAKAAKDAIFMHCLPAVVGDEVTAEVLRGPQSVILDEAENRLWTAMAVLWWALEPQQALAAARS